MTILSNINGVNYFNELPFYNKPIEKPKIKRLENIDLLTELPFYEQLSIIKTNQAFRGCGMLYKVEIVERKDLILQLEAIKSSIKDLFSDLLNDYWINEGCGWIAESIESQYINISTYKPLLGSSYIDLPIELRSPRKGLINIKNKDQKCFLWCHVRHINPSNEHPERIRLD